MHNYDSLITDGGPWTRNSVLHHRDGSRRSCNYLVSTLDLEVPRSIDDTLCLRVLLQPQVFQGTLLRISISFYHRDTFLTWYDTFNHRLSLTCS